ncbi:sporulation membrane protein YtrI [Bacillus sp. B1-b2]|uniref:sporulation membrane protein YtrI n=1 Tax=Bacillus sp. B1-b2 TaxID=2653201 RepID=UPI001261D95E|nr:sporulation membrane protein YtrI [Bacillus sp. B1-b2]KAB7668001.1 sporulation protein [Bacillus sp. B1-b2]
MRIPPLYNNRAIQRLFAGMVIGGVISWCIFVFIFGVWQERYSTELKTQKATIEDLEKEKKIWQEEFSQQNKSTEEKLTVESLVVKINSKDKEKYNIQPFNAVEMEDAIKEDLTAIMAKDLDMVYKSRALLKKSIENKVVTSDKKRYKFKVTELIIYTTVHVELSVTFAD